MSYGFNKHESRVSYFMHFVKKNYKIFDIKTKSFSLKSV